ncbi:hypothetical protein [Variovorax ginsengisoli]|uniref:Uncharacterized protein n=1 Tax=Variovorax ginsengisoli TaxID=363844 RepID=A0ABT9S489_9BURK|nr:hypothetical protein [Variovorax ginsengisoli]MDP9899154.1 hypothetical protein [Variovorax ginsengisoli]
MGTGLQVVLAASVAAGNAALAASPTTGAAQALRDTQQALGGRLGDSPFGRPLVLDSMELPEGLKGDVYAIVDHPLQDVAAALKTPARWCEALILHINNRRCQVATDSGREVLTLSVVRRYDKPVDSAFTLPFLYRTIAMDPDYMAVELSAESGPLGTRSYRVVLEAVRLRNGRTFLHFSYAYEHNLVARVATQAYLATFGSDKVGFTALGRLPGGETDWIRGTRGLVERNAMRYFLAVEAYLSAMDVPAPQQQDARLLAWYEATERYPRQLHEIDLASYLALKREDRLRNGPP